MLHQQRHQGRHRCVVPDQAKRRDRVRGLLRRIREKADALGAVPLALELDEGAHRVVLLVRERVVKQPDQHLRRLRVPDPAQLPDRAGALPLFVGEPGVLLEDGFEVGDRTGEEKEQEEHAASISMDACGHHPPRREAFCPLGTTHPRGTHVACIRTTLPTLEAMKATPVDSGGRLRFLQSRPCVGASS
jgi:hypothetical protein